MKAGIVQKIFLDHFAAYRKQKSLWQRRLRAAWCIMTCKTPAQGYHIDACPNGDYQVKAYNSCKHRACPQCGAADTQLWLERRKAQALDCPYFHIVFTISHDLHKPWRANRKLFTSLMMRAGWHSLRDLLADWKYLGGLAGAIGVFQSWDDEMREHCHLHFIVTAGGLNEDSRWVRANSEFLLPTKVLATKFRGKFLAYLKEGFSRVGPSGKPKQEAQILKAPYGMSVQQCFNLLNKLGRKRWHADIEPAYAHAFGVFKYLGRYLCRGPVSEKRIVGYDGDTVTIAYAHRDKHERQTFSLSASDFIDRLLRHVPDKGSHVVRAYGLFHPNCRDKLDAARKLLGQEPYVPILQLPSAVELLQRMFPEQQIGICPHCKRPLRTVFVYRGGHVSPWKLAA
ncbi:MAG: transposase [Phycisphaerae bacterium]|nr:transposase [Phycisphaerae bacterium]